MDCTPALALVHSSRHSLSLRSSHPLAIFIGSTGFLQLPRSPLPCGYGVCPARPHALFLLIMRTLHSLFFPSLSWCYALYFMLVVRLVTDLGSIPTPTH